MATVLPEQHPVPRPTLPPQNAIKSPDAAGGGRGLQEGPVLRTAQLLPVATHSTASSWVEKSFLFCSNDPPSSLALHLCLHTGVLEKPLDKKAGRNYGPPGTKKLIYFIDDLNMPEVDAYGTVQPHTLIRQHLDYGHW